MDIKTMNVKEFLVANPKVTKKSFGEFIKQRREQKNYTVRGLAAELDMTPAYLSDIEKGNRYAPKKYLDDICRLLDISKESEEFNDLVCGPRGDSSPDIYTYLGEQPLARVALRKAKDKGIPDDIWEEFIKEIDKKY